MSRRRSTLDSNRGQMTLDFAIGVSVFLVVVTSVLAFVPGMLQPFESSTQQETAAADRVVEQLSAGMLVEDEREPYVLDRECTVIFFESREDGSEDPAGDDEENWDGNGDYAAPFDSGTYEGTCNFDDVPVDERLALTDARLDVRVRLVRDLTVGELDNPNNGTDDSKPDTLCIDANSDNRIIEAGDPLESGTQCDITSDDDDVVFAIGDEPPAGSSSVVVARRTVHFSGGFGDETSDAMLVVEVW